MARVVVPLRVSLWLVSSQLPVIPVLEAVAVSKANRSPLV